MESIELLNKDSPQAKQPSSISISLKPHQLACLHKMLKLDLDCEINNQVQGNIGILGDIPGSGKTLTVLSLIVAARDQQRKQLSKMKVYSHMEYGVCIHRQRTVTFNETSLLVVPDSLVSHWEHHADQWTDLRFETITDDNYISINVDALELVICPASLYRDFIDGENCEYWDRVIFDETDSIRLPNTKYVSARFLWAITSTYYRLHLRSNNGFLKDLFKSRWGGIIDRYLSPFVVQCESQFIRESFSLESPVINRVRCALPRYISAISGFVNESVVMKIHAGDIDSAILELGGNIETDNNLIDLITKNFHNQIVKVQSQLEVLDKMELTPAERESQQAKYSQKLESLQTRQTSLIESVRNASQTDCMICCDTLDHPTMVSCCQQMFCAECLIEWLKASRKCPLCRGEITFTELVTIGEKPQNQEPPELLPTKKEAMISIIKKRPGGRFLVFSEYTFKHLGSELTQNGMKWGTLTLKKTAENLRKFKNREINVLLANAKNNGAGLEIPEATDVILFHSMSPELETQTIGRAHRPGRIGPVNVWKLRNFDE